MAKLAIIGGTGLSNINEIKSIRHQVFATPYGEPSGPFTIGELAGCEVVFLPRHGYNHRIPPHQINYRANIWALRELGIKRVLAIGAVTAVRPGLHPGDLLVPDQIIDYTHNRGATFYEGDLTAVTHIDFRYPYAQPLREAFLRTASALDVPIHDGGVYGARQGPRLETLAEVHKISQDGCDVIGMTGMPEAALAREAALDYAALNVLINSAAADQATERLSISEMNDTFRDSMDTVRAMLVYMLAHRDPAICPDQD